jgi:hypothetical protein
MSASLLPGTTGKPEKQDGIAEREWREVLAWKRVPKLSTTVPAFGSGQQGDATGMGATPADMDVLPSPAQ